MQLLFFYASFHENGKSAQYHGFEEFSLNFSREMLFRVENGAVYGEKRQTEVPEYFWKGQIYNVTALVGENAAGKTTILQYVACVLASLAGTTSIDIDLERTRLRSENKILLWDEEGKRICQINFEWCNGLVRIGQLEALDWKTKKHISWDFIKSRLATVKLIYQSNTLTLADLEFEKRISRDEDNKNDRSRCREQSLYNISAVAWLMRQHHAGENCNTARFSPGELLTQYFTEIQYRQVKFVFDRKQNQILKSLKENDISVPYASQLMVRIQHFSEKEEKSLCELFPESSGYIKSVKEKNGHEIEILVWQLSCQMVLNYLNTLSILLSNPQRRYQTYQNLLSCSFKTSNSSQEVKLTSKEFFEVLEAAFESEKSKMQIEECKEAELEKEASKSFIELVFDSVQQGENVHYSLERYIHPKRVVFRQDFDQETLPEVQLFSISTGTKEDEEHPFVEFLRRYRYACDVCYFLDFSWGLSSGENAMLSMFSDLYYLYKEDYANHEKEDYAIYSGKNKCDSLLLFMDEADMLYHPEWQRKFLAGLTAFITRLYPRSVCNSIQIILTTHSPLMLGDVPSQNVIYLKRKNGMNEVDADLKRPTFAQNLYLMLKDSFYLENGAMGEIARKKLKEAINEIQKAKALTERNKDVEIGDCWEQLQRIRKGTLDLLAPGLIESKLREEIESCEKYLQKISRNDYKNLSNEGLYREIERMQQELKRREQT